MKSVVIVLALICVTTNAMDLWEGPNPCDSLPNGPGSSGFVNDPRDCAAYFSCVGGNPFNVRCPSGFYFDESREVCDLPELVKCNACPASGIASIAVPYSCTKWTLCVNGNSMPRECAPGTRFNPTIGGCDLDENVPCATDTCASLDSGTGIAPSPDSCIEYFYCYAGNKLMRGECSNGLSFDTLTKRCVRIGNGVCFPGTSVGPARRFVAPVRPQRY